LAVKTAETSPEGVLDLVVEIKGKPLHYLKAGSGRPLVLLHGGASDSRDWLPAIPFLSQHFTCYAPDMPGFGKNGRDEKGYFLSDFIDSIEEFTLTLGLENPDFTGHSFGARVGTGIALKGRVKVRKLVLVDAVGFGKVTAYGTALMTGFWALRKIFRLPQPYPVFRHKEGDDPDWCCDTEVPSLKIPVLLVWKHHDPYMPVSQGHKAQKLIPGSRLEIIPGYGHAPNKKNVAVFTKLLLDFLED
jgi:pimeloyl-ACP methyl ester carboxylesterase